MQLPGLELETSSWRGWEELWQGQLGCPENCEREWRGGLDRMRQSCLVDRHGGQEDAQPWCLVDSQGAYQQDPGTQEVSGVLEVGTRVSFNFGSAEFVLLGL